MLGEKFRFWLPVVLILALAANSGTRLVLAHIAPSVQKKNRYDFSQKLPGTRGRIYDAEGKLLVNSVPIWEYHLDPVVLTNRVVRESKKVAPRTPQAILNTVACLLKLDYRRLLERSKRPERYQFLKASDKQEIYDHMTNSHQIAGIVIEDRQKREYFNGRTMSHVLGATGGGTNGLAGIELRYNTKLNGLPGKIEGKRDAVGRELYDKRVISIDPVPGVDISLTLDVNLQREVESMLADGIREFGAGAGWCVVLDAETGAVKALASNPDFNPLDYGNVDDRARRNRAINYNYEPGSVMKVVTACAAIDTGMVSPRTLVSTDRFQEGYYKLPSDHGHVWEPMMSVSNAIVHSCNIVVGKLGVNLTYPRLREYMVKFGFGHRTGIELPGEEIGILPSVATVAKDRVKPSRAPIGQGVSVTAIQLASAFQAIANDGRRMRPHVIRSIVGYDRKGRAIEEKLDTPCLAATPIKASTARTLRQVMLGVASREGTARRAAVRGYSVAGKTGTAQKWDFTNRRYFDHLFHASFCGIVPSGIPQRQGDGSRRLTMPKVVILVTLDFDERRPKHQGGNSSAVIFRRIATAAMRLYNVEPDRPAELEEFQDDDEFNRLMDERARAADAVRN